MMNILYRVLLDTDVDWGDRLRDGLRDMWLEDVRVYAVCIMMALCILTFAVIFLVVTVIIEKKNDYGDEDEMKMRKGTRGFAESVNARVHMDISTGSINCMKRFQYRDITKR